MSAYQDKLLDQRNRHRKVLVRKYGSVSFENFVRMILDKASRSCRQMNNCNLNRHWQPFISRCGYCNVPYKVVAKAENFAEDQKFIGRLANIDFKPISSKWILLIWLHSIITETHTSSGGSTRKQAKDYFSQLSRDTVKRLYNLYKADFELFEYSPEMYYNYAYNNDFWKLCLYILFFCFCWFKKFKK